MGSRSARQSARPTTFSRGLSHSLLSGLRSRSRWRSRSPSRSLNLSREDSEDSAALSRSRGPACCQAEGSEGKPSVVRGGLTTGSLRQRVTPPARTLCPAARAGRDSQRSAGPDAQAAARGQDSGAKGVFAAAAVAKAHAQRRPEVLLQPGDAGHLNLGPSPNPNPNPSPNPNPNPSPSPTPNPHQAHRVTSEFSLGKYDDGRDARLSPL